MTPATVGNVCLMVSRLKTISRSSIYTRKTIVHWIRRQTTTSRFPSGGNYVIHLGEFISSRPGDLQHKNATEESNGRLKGCRQSINRGQNLKNVETSKHNCLDVLVEKAGTAYEKAYNHFML